MSFNYMTAFAAVGTLLFWGLVIYILYRLVQHIKK